MPAPYKVDSFEGAPRLVSEHGVPVLDASEHPPLTERQAKSIAGLLNRAFIAGQRTAKAELRAWLGV